MQLTEERKAAQRMKLQLQFPASGRPHSDLMQALTEADENET